jgi:hypothetical protein
VRVTVIFEDDMIGVEGVFYAIPCQPADPNSRVIQWTGESGVIEVYQGDRVWLDDIGAVQPYLDAWRQRDAQIRAAMVAAQAPAIAQKPPETI